MGGAKFMVRGGQRWRDLDLASGHVSGWGGVSFVCVRRGRLELVPRAPMLRALRALAAGGLGRSGRQHGAAKDGPRLSQIRYPATVRQSTGRRQRQAEGCSAAQRVHTCCQQHHMQCNTDANFNSIFKPPTITVGVQCSVQAAAAVQATLACADRLDRGCDTVAQQLPADRPQRNKDHEREGRRGKGRGSEGFRRRTLISSKKKVQYSSSDTVVTAEALRRDNSQRKKGLTSLAIETKVVQVGRNLSQEVVSSDSDFESRRKKNSERNKGLTREAIETQTVPVRRNHSQESVSSDSDYESRRKKNLQRNKGHGSKGSSNKNRGGEGGKGEPLSGRYEPTQDTPCKELLISEETVMLLRSFIEHDERNVFGVDLELYDTDDAYKTQFFYRLNPIVDMERCPQISRMLRDRASQADSVSLQDFITTLGLRSVTDTSTGQTRYRMRVRRKGGVTRPRSGSESETDENNTRVDRALEENKCNKHHNRLGNHQSKPGPSSRTKARGGSRKELQEVMDVSNYRERSKKPKEVQVTHNRERKDLKEVGDVSNDKEQRKKPKEVDRTNNREGGKDLKELGHMANKKEERKDWKEVRDVSKKKEGRKGLIELRDVSNKKEGREVDGTNNKRRKDLEEVEDGSNKEESKKLKEKKGGKTAKGKRRGARDYSQEEDAHIVRWVRGAGRASMVNGNRLWAQLQPAHEADTGCFRTWQSLRNRYLRYLLPALGAMEVPPLEAARLRAAAATGEIKARKLPARRNSAFHQPPVQSAWGRLPRPKPQETLIVSDAEEEASQSRSLRSANMITTLASAAHQSPPRKADKRTRTPTYSELTKRFALRHRSTPNSDSVPLTDTTASVSSTSTDRRVPRTRRSTKRAGSGSDSDAQPAPKRRRTTRQLGESVLIVDTDSDSWNIDKKARHSGKTERNVKNKRVQSKSLDRDTDSEPNKRRTSGRRRGSSSGSGGRQIDSSRRLADKKESNKRRKTRSQDSDASSHRASKHLKSSGRQNETSADKSDRHRDKSAQRADDTNKQSGGKSDSLRLNGNVTETRQRLSADLALINNYRQSGKRGRQSDKNVRNDSDENDRHTEKSFRRADKTDRQNGSTHDGVKNGSPRDTAKVTEKRGQNAELLSGRHRQSQADTSDRQQERKAERVSDKSDRHGGRSAQNDEHGLRRNSKGRFLSGRRKRRLYNPRAM